MSLIVARIDGFTMSILSDTKLTYPDHEIKQYHTSPTDGLIKSVIVNEDVCISFAGEVEPAELALKEINSSTPRSDIIDVLEKFHSISQANTEFILCFGKPSLTIYEIKNGKTKSVEQSWIGDKAAFEIFQQSVLSAPTKAEQHFENSPRTKDPSTDGPLVTITDMNLSMEINPLSPYFSKLSAGMDAVIEDQTIQSVGGFKINILYQNKFYYNTYIKTFRHNVSFVGFGTYPIGHGNAQDGSYTVNFVGGSDDWKSVALHISQGAFGLIYHRRENGLLRPEVRRMDEIDFLDEIATKFSIVAPLSTQDRVAKYFSKAAELFHKRNYAESETYLNKGFESAPKDQKANFLINKGILLMKLSDKRPANDAFLAAMKLDPSTTNSILKILNRKY